MKKTIIQFILLLLLSIMSNIAPAMAQDLPLPPAFDDEPATNQPTVKQSAPSGDMDFILPKEAVDGGDELPPPSPENTVDGGLLSDVDAPKIDQFFSSTKIISPDKEQPEIREIAAPEPVIEKKQVKKVVKKTYVAPSFNYKTVSLPNSIYHRPNSNYNRHLPTAYFKKDWKLLLGEAVKTNNINQLRALVANGADARGDDATGVPLLILASRYKRVDVVRWLLMQGSNPNINDDNGFTPLHYAVIANNQALISLLLLYKADPQITDNRGLTPEYYAKNNGGGVVLNNIASSGY